MSVSDEIKGALESLHKFIINEEITQGANAYAFKAFHTVLKRDVFLKVFYYSEDASTDLLKEPQMLVKATQANPVSANVVQLFDADLIKVGSDKYLCLQMEFVEGFSLLTALDGGPLGQQDAVRMAQGVLHGVSNLHSKRILHRDLKPANIVVQGQTPKITDFGSAVLLADEQTEVPASKHSAVYVPPEGWENPSRFSFQSDVYQVAIVLYELVNGRLDYTFNHYVTPSLTRELAKSGKALSDLDDFDKSTLINRGIAELALKQKLLAHGRAPQPYFSDKIARIIKAGTHPDLAKRFASADGMLARLSQVDVPNWRPSGAGSYLAPAWRGWDWTLACVGSMVVVKKSRPSQNAFRRVATKQTLEQAFRFVESV